MVVIVRSGLSLGSVVVPQNISSLVLIMRLTRILLEIYELVVIKYRVLTQAIKPKIAEWRDLEALYFFSQVKCSRGVFHFGFRKPTFRQKTSYWFLVVFRCCHFLSVTHTNLFLAMSPDRFWKTEKVCVGKQFSNSENCPYMLFILLYYIHYGYQF